MKSSKYNTRDASNVPKKMSLKDPFTNELIRDAEGDTVDLYVYGTQSDVSRNAMKARDRKYGKGNNLSDEQAEQAGAEYLAAVTQGWSKNLGAIYEGETVEMGFSKENAIELFRAEDWIAGQVLEFSRNLTNYDPKL